MGVTAQMDIDRWRSPRLLRSNMCSDGTPLMLARYVDEYETLATALGWLLVDVIASSASWAAKHGSEPATDPDVELPRRNKPITDLFCFGFDSPPSQLVCFALLIWFFIFLLHCKCECVFVLEFFFKKMCDFVYVWVEFNRFLFCQWKLSQNFRFCVRFQRKWREKVRKKQKL